jgi:hypothetical protein
MTYYGRLIAKKERIAEEKVTIIKRWRIGPVDPVVVVVIRARL